MTRPRASTVQLLSLATAFIVHGVTPDVHVQHVRVPAGTSKEQTGADRERLAAAEAKRRRRADRNLRNAGEERAR